MRFLTVVFLFSALAGIAQERFTISGYIRDKSNGETLIGATVFAAAAQAGVVTNEYGFYSLTLAKGSYQLTISYVGFDAQAVTIELNANRRLDIELVSEAEQLEEVVVTGEIEQANARNLEMSTNKLDIKVITRVPAFLGESDVLKSLLLLPGVSTVGEGASGFNVRGGSVGQNLVLLDEAPVYNTSHLFGFFSVFNPDAVKDTKLYKGAVPSRYGGRLASLLDVRMKEGNSKKPEVTGGIGTVFSRLAVEAPIVKDKASFIVAARRSYLDVLARPFTEIFSDGAALNFYDLTAKTNWNINPRNRVYLSG
ncbi:MAG: TonB-dependent receptor, partial [Bacteroidota bacterium]